MKLWARAREALQRFQRKASGADTEPGCDHRSVPHQPGTPEFELFVARNELKAGNLEHGARHLAALISYDPANQEWLALLHEYLRNAGNDDSRLYPIKDKRYFAEEAVRAYVWARQGRLNEALELLVQVVEAKPDSTYLDDWAVDWLKQDEALAAVPRLTLERILAVAVNRFPERRWLRRKDSNKLEGYAEIAAHVPATLRSSPAFQMLHAGILRKLGRFEEALAVARDTTLTAVGWHSLVAAGLALRERGDCDAAAAAFEQALTFNPDDLSARLEAGDGYLRHHAWDKAHAWYMQVLQRQADHPWAFPSALFCQWKSSGDNLKHKRLREMAYRIPPNPRAEQLLRVAEPYVGILPLPADAIANAVRSIDRAFRDKPPDKPGGDIAITVSHLESPSATLALEEQLKALGHPLPIIVTVKAIPQPDPRQPCRPIRYELWKYAGTDASPALAAPPPSILQIVSALASNPFERDENFKDARLAAQGLSEEQIPQLLAAMVHPPPIPADKDALEWLPRVQLAAAQIIAQVGNTWHGSTRREALLAALLGPRDWVTVAAIVALAHLAEEQPEVETDVNEAFSTLSNFIPDGGYCCFAHALFGCWQWLPNLSVQEKQMLQERLLDLEEG
jgi:tetratricopeptide (TPR) repeat protein